MLMKLKMRVILILICLLFGINSGIAETIYSPGIQQILAKGKLVVALHKEDLPPMYSVDKQGKLVGYDIELAQYMGKHLGVPVEFLRTAKTFDEIIDLVNEGKADLGISALTANLIRARKVTFTKPYLDLDILLAYNRLSAAQDRGVDPIEQIRTKKGLKIGVLEGSSYNEHAKAYAPDIVLVEYPTVKSVLSAIEKGEIFGFLSDSANLLYTLKQEPDTRLYIGVSNLKDKKDPIAIAVSWKYADLVTWLNLALTLRELEHLDNNFIKEYASSAGEQ